MHKEGKQLTDDQIRRIAEVCHEANRIYCVGLSDYSHSIWALTPENIQKSAMSGVELHAKFPDAGPEASHEAWLAYKEKEGWVYGDVKDYDKKTHPCMVPFDELTEEQQRKDVLFRNIVHALVHDLNQPQLNE